MDWIDLRSDTVTLPTDEMLKYIQQIKLGDDVLEEDYTVKKLEKKGAKLFGKEAALLTPSGTMSNQIATMVYTERGDEVIVGEESHIYNLEVAALSTLSQVQPRAISCPKGYLHPDTLKNTIQNIDLQRPKTGLICLENTYNLNKGYVMKPSNILAIKKICKNYRIPIYMDGARIFNASTALKIPVKELVQHVDSVQVCLTKGLSAPIGSLLLGTRNFINKARRIRQRLGGGMRQAGIIAGFGIVGLETMRDELQKDHHKALLLAQRIYEIDNRMLNINDVETNIISIDTKPLRIESDKILSQMYNNNIKMKKIGSYQIRIVTHRHITDSHIDKVLSVLTKAINRYS